MPPGEALLPEFDQEMAITRRVLERVPSEKGSWKPHTKSFAMGHLAQLVSWMPGWITNTLREPALDLGMAGGYSFETTETLLQVSMPTSRQPAPHCGRRRSRPGPRPGR